ncbi:hypothetical protein [Harryflintia acetispora]|uniref:Uncharacterized protein n=1 Tax=Harryflintia acetispora TaxID=1849041 RepID=A0A9X8UJ77_9FIRM|nr:hypothetical protein [Harryflintia acetispora]TCL43208.1 hypothetical protein EDD78_10668 [Harryflintia acetispora]
MDGATIAMFVFQTVVTAIVGIAAWGIKNAIAEIKAVTSDLKEADRENAERIIKVEEKLNDLKADLPLIYVTREDYIRIMNRVEDKLDQIIYGGGCSSKGKED